MDNQINVNWDCITGVFDQAPIFPITLIDAEILDYWCAHPAVWEVAHNMQHSRCVLAMVCYTLVSGPKGKPVIYGALFVYIPAHQAQTSLTDALSYLKHSKVDCVVLVSTPIKPTYSPQPWRGRYFTMLPINGNPDTDHGPLSSFAAATLHVASREGRGDNMAIRIKLPPSFGSSKQPKMELIVESVLSRGPLWKNTHYVERSSSSKIVKGWNGQSLCRELEISLCAPGVKLEYTPTCVGHPAPLTLAACHPGWDDYLDLNETVAEMSQHLIDEDEQLEGAMPKGGAVPKEKEIAKVVVLPSNEDTVFVSTTEFPGAQHGLGTRENPVNLSDTPTEASHTRTHPESAESLDEPKLLGHFSDALSEMAESLMDLEDSYFKALCEVIVEMERALRDISRIDAHYVSQVVMVMASWQEAVQTAATHMENTDLTMYLTCREDAWRMMKEYVAVVIKARDERDAAHAKETEAWKQAIKTGHPEDPVVRLLEATHQAARAQAVRAVDAFLKKIKETLRKYVPVSAQGPLIANALSTAFQFQMSMWQMVGDECVHPLRAKHSDWCGLAGMVQAIVETFPNNCAIMFPQAPAPAASFSATFRPASSEEEDEDDNPFGPGMCRFDSGTPTPSGHGHSSSGCSPAFSSTPLPEGGCFILVSDRREPPSSSLSTPPLDVEESETQPLDKDLDAGLEADDEGDREKDPHEGDDSIIDASEIEILKSIVKPGTNNQVPIMPKSGEKRGSGHLDGSVCSDLSGKDLDAKDAWNRKKGSIPIKVGSSNTGQWTEEDIDVVCQICYKMDLDRFQTYQRNKIKPEQLNTINTVDHSAYIAVAKADVGTVIKKSVFSVAAYREVLWLRGSDTSKFDKEVGAKFKKSAKGSRVPDTEKVSIDRIMLVCQRENGVDMAYGDLDGFGHPGTMGLWDLHSSDTLSQAKMQLASGQVDANFCPLCAFWSTNNDETLNNHVRKHYKMGLTCRSDCFTMASMAPMKAHMEAAHGYEGKCSGQAKKQKGKS